jgi:hypothetical protein
MEQRDLLKDQIEQIGKALAKILSELIGLKSKGQISQGIEITHQSLKGELDLETEQISTLTKKELKDYLINRHLKADHLEILSECLTEIAKGEIEQNKKYIKVKLEKAIELLNLADEISKTMSFHRINKKKEIESLLKQSI